MVVVDSYVPILPAERRCEFPAGSSGRQNGHRQRRNDQKNDFMVNFDFQVGSKMHLIAQIKFQAPSKIDSIE